MPLPEEELTNAELLRRCRHRCELFPRGAFHNEAFMLMRLLSAIILQKWWRRVEEKNGAAIVVQRWWRKKDASSRCG